jgi:CRP-like cAMP-binding protein
MANVRTGSDEFRVFLNQLAPVDGRAWTALNPLISFRKLKKRQFFVRAGDPARAGAFVIRGLLESYRIAPQGKEAIKRFCPEGTFAAPYTDLILGRPSTAYLRALEPTALLVIDYPGWLAAMENFACFQKIGRLLAEREFVEREERELQFMIMDASTRLEEFKRKYPGLEKRIPANRLAAYLGVNPVTLSRLENRREIRLRVKSR